jgi:hypothetical protein
MQLQNLIMMMIIIDIDVASNAQLVRSLVRAPFPLTDLHHEGVEEVQPYHAMSSHFRRSPSHFHSSPFSLLETHGGGSREDERMRGCVSGSHGRHPTVHRMLTLRTPPYTSTYTHIHTHAHTFYTKHFSPSPYPFGSHTPYMYARTRIHTSPLQSTHSHTVLLPPVV